MRVVVAALLCAQAACTSGGYRYPSPGAPPPLAWVDTLPIDEPTEIEADDTAHRLRDLLSRQPSHALSVTRAISGVRPALNVDAFDGVVASTWFQERITGTRLAPATVAQGPPLPGPDMSRPLQVVGGKVEGVTSGLTVEDGGGVRFLLKFDPPGMSGLGSGADVVSSRIFWAAGYNTPKDVVLHLHPSQLVVSDGAEIDGGSGPRAMTWSDVEKVLSGTDHADDGTIRVLASRFIEGTPRGPFRFRGMRPDDPNDHYPHEDRRELRGLWVLASWVNHVDLRVDNTLDSFIEAGGYLRHYLIDFATTLGSGAIRPLNAREGLEYAFDPIASLGRLFTLGAYRVGWEGVDDDPLHPSLGWLASEDFDPGAWKPFIPNDAWLRLTPRDGYWGAKIVAAFDSSQVRAIIEEADYPDDVAHDLHHIMMVRRLRVLEHWFAQVSPVEEVSVEMRAGVLEVAFHDLALRHGLNSAGQTQYAWRVGHLRGVQDAQKSVDTRQRVRIEVGADLQRLLDLATDDAPAILELSAVRTGKPARAARVRLASDPSGSVRIVGLIH